MVRGWGVAREALSPLRLYRQGLLAVLGGGALVRVSVR